MLFKLFKCLALAVLKITQTRHSALLFHKIFRGFFIHYFAIL